MNKKILFLIDFQNDFVAPDGLLSINNPALIKKGQSFMDNLPKTAFENIIVTMDTHFKSTWNSTIESKSFPLHCEYGTDGFDLAIKLKSDLPVRILYKSTTDIWAEATQYSCLNEDFSDKDIYLAGLVTEICVKNALDGLLKKNPHSITLISDLTGGIKQSAAELFAEYKDKHPQLYITTCAEFLENCEQQNPVKTLSNDKTRE